MKSESTTEAEMRAEKAPWPDTLEALNEYITSLVDRQHDYGTCVYAMSMAAVAAFYYVSSKLGVTGFQASCADKDILRRTRHIDGPFMIVNGRDLLYPQSDVRQKVEEFIEESRGWCGEQARKNLADSEHAHPNVRAHWEALAAAAPTK